MNWTEYKARAERPDHWTVWMLEQCCDLLRQCGAFDLARQLECSARNPRIATPLDFRGPPQAALVQLDLDVRVRRAILACIHQALDKEFTTDATRERGLGGFVEAWQEYCDYENSDR
ncbi:MAG: hypothetical protein AAF513_17230 [Pseudomonadota bacterium]